MILALCVAAFVASALAVRVFIQLSRRRLLDAPGARSSHARPTPTGAGFPSVLVGLAAAGAGGALGLLALGPRYWAVALCVAVLASLGLADDALNLPRSLRYGAHLLVAAAAVYWLQPAWLELTASEPPLLARALAVAALLLVTGLINLFNFMDGIDALVAGTGVVILAFLGWRSDDPLWYCFAAVYAGLLIFNLPPARTFMGDAGSTTLGGLVAIALLSAPARLALADLVVLGPLMGDAVYTILRRLLRRENIFVAHHSHVYQRLFRAGVPHGKISLGYALASALAALLASTLGNTGAALALFGGLLTTALIERRLHAKAVPFARPSPSAEPEARSS